MCCAGKQALVLKPDPNLTMGIKQNLPGRKNLPLTLEKRPDWRKSPTILLCKMSQVEALSVNEADRKTAPASCWTRGIPCDVTVVARIERTWKLSRRMCAFPSRVVSRLTLMPLCGMTCWWMRGSDAFGGGLA